MKKYFKKFVILILVLLILINTMYPIVLAASDKTKPAEIKEEEFEFSLFSDADGLGGVADGVVGFILWGPRAIIATAVTISETLLSQLVLGVGNGSGFIVDMEDIIFAGGNGVDAQVNLLDINFFDLSSGDDIVSSLRNGVAKWYYALRNIAIVISLIVLIYIGIRMAISTVASDKAQYKKMLKDWTMGFIMLFILHFIMVIVINLNNQLVGIIYEAGGVTQASMGSYEVTLFKNVFSLSFVKGWGSLAIIGLLLGVKIMFFIIYARRLFTIGFLIAISPLITITYSIDKIGDQKSQALNNWMKEFVFNILIQPFHCIIYLMFVTAAMGILQTGDGILRAIVFACLAILFMHKAEDIVKKIFGINQASSLLGAAAAGAVAGNLLDKANKFGSSAGKVKQKISDKTGKNNVQRRMSPEVVAGAAAGAAANSGNTGGANDAGNNATGGTANSGDNSAGGANNAGNNASEGANNANNNTAAGAGNAGSDSNAVDTSSENNYSHSNPIRRALNDRKQAVKEAVNNFKADPKSAIGNGAKNLARSAGQMSIRAMAKTMKAAPHVALGLVTAGATGNAITGYVAGKYAGKFTRKIVDPLNAGERMDEWADNLKDKNEFEKELNKLESRASTAYENYKLANPEMSDEDLKNKSEELLSTRLSSIADDNERAYAQSLKNLYALYANNQAAQPKKLVMSKVEDIQMGKIKTHLSINEKAITKAVDEMKKQNPMFNNKDDVVRVAKEFIDDINSSNANGQKYMETDKYKNLSKVEKNLAKEIYKSKKVLSAIGDDRASSVDEQIQNIIEKQF